MEIQRRVAAAWVTLAEGRQAEALALMREAADMEDATDKAAVTPGPIKPARELLGEMLLQLNRPAEALVAFEATMKKEPNRFRALYGAARAADGGRTARRRPLRLRHPAADQQRGPINRAGKSWKRRGKRRGDGQSPRLARHNRVLGVATGANSRRSRSQEVRRTENHFVFAVLLTSC